MNRANALSRTMSIGLLAAVTLFPGVEARAVLSEITRWILTTEHSPMANAMGTCAVNQVTPESALMNPGTLGTFHLDRLAAASFPSQTKWFPGVFRINNILFETQSFSVGISTAMLGFDDSRFNASLGLAYARKDLDIGTVIGRLYSDPYSPPQVGASADAKHYTVSIGVDYYIKTSVGITHKEIRSKVGDPGSGWGFKADTADGTATDVGFYVEVPILDFVSQDIYLDHAREYPVTFAVTPSFAYVNANAGDDITYDDITYIDTAQADPLPHVERIGVALYFAAKVKDAAVLSGRFTWQENRALVGSPEKSRGTGAEIGLFNALYYRWGNFKDPAGVVDIKTSGYGFSLAGLISALGIISDWKPEQPWLRYVHEHVDLTYDSAEFADDANGPLNGTKFVKVSLSL